MDIQFSCVCGSQLKAAPAHAGTSCLCPYCRRVVVIPDFSSSSAEPSDNTSGVTREATVDAPIDATIVDEALPVQEFLRTPPYGQSPLPGNSSPGNSSPGNSSPGNGSPNNSSPGTALPGTSSPGTWPSSSSSSDAATSARVPSPTPERGDWAKRMLIALLDPNAILWLLTFGGGLSVLGLVIWLTSLGVFKNPFVVAGSLGAGSVATLAVGCWLALSTRFVTAGKALSFLSCVVLPLNLWYYESQGMMAVEGNLWVAAFVICWLYVGVVYLLRDAVFLYAVEAGVTLTTLLMMASLGRLTDVTYLSLTLVVLGLISVHAERSFPPDSTTFPRRRFGMALFWSGQTQLIAGLGFLLASQIIREFFQSAGLWLSIRWTGVLLTDWNWLAAGVWLAGAYAWLYSDIVVRRAGVYTYLAGVCLMFAGVTVVGLDVATESLIIVLAAMAVGAALLSNFLPTANDRYRRSLGPASLLLGFLSVALGAVAHLRATNVTLAETTWARETGWYFVLALATAAAANRLLVALPRGRDKQSMSAHLFLSAAALLIGAAGVLRQLELLSWQQQAPLLMIIPVIYLLVSRLRVEREVRDPLQWISHAATAVIMGSIFFGSFQLVGRVLMPVSGHTENLLAGIVFAEAMLFYGLAAWIRRHAANYYLATIAGCAMAWEWMGYGQIPSDYYTLLYASLGVTMLGVSRGIGVVNEVVSDPQGRPITRLLGPGRPLYLVANGLIAMAVVAAIFQSLAQLLFRQSDTEYLVALLLTTGAGGMAAILSRSGPERWWHATGTTILAILTVLTFNVLLDLNLWRKAEIVAVVLGSAMLIAGNIGRFSERGVQDLASVGLWLGSLLIAGALSLAVLTHGIMVSPADDLALLTFTILMVASGIGFQFKAPTLIGGVALGVYLASVLVDLAYSPQVAVGVYLAFGGLALFLVGVALSMCRERLLELPDQLARREGVFKIIGWR